MLVLVTPTDSGVIVKPRTKGRHTYTMGTVMLKEVCLSPTGPIGILIEEFTEQWPPGRIANMMTRLRIEDGRFLTREKKPVDLTGKSFKAAYVVGNSIYVSKD